MFQKIKNNETLKELLSTKNLGLYLFLIVSLSVAWSTARIIQKNYDLQKQITTLSQEVALQEQINQNQKLKNQYFETDAYLELAARKYFLKGLPGERLYAVPKEVAMSKITAMPTQEKEQTNSPKKTLFFVKNWQDWLKFLQGQQLKQP
jgi:cell division protein FtsB